MNTDQSVKNSPLVAVRPDVRPYVNAAMVTVLCVWLAYTLFATLQRIASLYVPVPLGDYWRIPQHLKAYQTLQLGVFWRQHNEHRIIFPEIVFALDMLWAHGRMLLPAIVTVLCYAATLGVLCVTVTRDRAVPWFARCTGALMAAVLAFWQGSSLALAQPFLLEWTLTQLGVGLALFYLKKAADTGVAMHLAISIAAAVVATYSSANALLVWPLLLGLGYFSRLAHRLMAALAVAAVVSIGMYFVGYQFSGQTNVLAILRHPLYFLGFLATYLGMPFAKLISPTFGVVLGLLNLAAVIFCAVKAWRLRLLSTQTAFVLIGFYCFTLLTILITAAGRMEPPDREFTAATASRYLTVPLLNWAAVVLLLYWSSARLNLRFLSATGLTVAFALLLPIGEYKLRSWDEANEVPFADAQVAAMSLDTGLTDPGLIGRVFPSPEFLEMFMPPLKAQHLAIFGRGHDLWLGKKLLHLGVPSAETTMMGEITYLAPVERGLEVVGWVNSKDVRDPFPRILLVNELGQAVGWGRRPNARFPPDWLVGETPEREAWVAFANLSVPSKTIRAYVMSRRDLIPIPGAKNVPLLQGAARSDVSVPIADAVWRMDKGWGLGGMPISPAWGWRPTASPVYSSWHDRDDNTGQISVEFSSPANGCVSMATLHGPWKEGLSAQFLNADTGSVLADVPFRDHDSLWALWKIHVDSQVKRVRFVANDNGKNWGQWLGVSGPLKCY